MLAKEEVLKVAELARITLSDAEVQQLTEQLSSVLQHFVSLSEIDTRTVEPLVTPTDMESHWRADTVANHQGQEAAMANAPECVGHLFKVPPVVG